MHLFFSHRHSSKIHTQESNNLALFGSFYGSHSNLNHKDDRISNGVSHSKKVETTTAFAWGYQTVPTLYSKIQKV